jgi:isochorismate pyruvate lyase
MKDPADFKNIGEVRKAIDQIDYQIMKLFGERHRCTEEIVRFKKDRAGVIAKDRQKELLELRRKWAVDFGLDPELFERIFKMLINSNIRKQLTKIRP